MLLRWEHVNNIHVQVNALSWENRDRLLHLFQTCTHMVKLLDILQGTPRRSTRRVFWAHQQRVGPQQATQQPQQQTRQEPCCTPATPNRRLQASSQPHRPQSAAHARPAGSIESSTKASHGPKSRPCLSICPGLARFPDTIHGSLWCAPHALAMNGQAAESPD